MVYGYKLARTFGGEIMAIEFLPMLLGDASSRTYLLPMVPRGSKLIARFYGSSIFQTQPRNGMLGFLLTILLLAQKSLGILFYNSLT